MGRRRKHIAVAVGLQAVPLLGAVSCGAAASTAANEPGGDGLWSWLWLSVLLFGMGYAYVRRPLKMLITMVAGPLFALSSCTALIGATGFDFEHGHGDASKVTAAELQEALIIVGVEAILIADVWRLTNLYNRRLELEESVPPAPSMPGSSPPPNDADTPTPSSSP